MDESLQQILALAIVGAVVVLELLRRRRSKRSGKIGCDGCDSGKKTPNQTETPIKFHKRR